MIYPIRLPRGHIVYMVNTPVKSPALFAPALSSRLPLCVLACVCTVRYCGNTQRHTEGGGAWSSWARSYVFSLSLCERKGGGEKL